MMVYVILNVAMTQDVSNFFCNENCASSKTISMYYPMVYVNIIICCNDRCLCYPQHNEIYKPSYLAAANSSTLCLDDVMGDERCKTSLRISLAFWG